jgi:hypothetical protein
MISPSELLPALTRLSRGLLDALAATLPPRFDAIFEQGALPDDEKGACVTYSRVIAEVLGEFGIRAEVRPVFIITANQVAIDYREGRISLDEAKRRGGRIQYWGDIREGQNYQHAVCYIPSWDVIIDLGMARRASALVPSHPYWARDKKFPWWLQRFQFMSYPLENRGYDLYPEKVTKAKEIVREVIRKWL